MIPQRMECLDLSLRLRLLILESASKILYFKNFFRIFVDEEEELDLQNRGTEYIKSPEMLLLALNVNKNNSNFDRRRRLGTTRASDIWSLGCLFYELVTNNFIFYDPDWGRFYTRVTNKNYELITEAAKEKLGMSKINFETEEARYKEAQRHTLIQILINFLNWILVRNPMHRPTIEHVERRFRGMIKELEKNRASMLNLDSLRSNNSYLILGSGKEAEKKSTRELFDEIDFLTSRLVEENTIEENNYNQSSKDLVSYHSFSPDFMLILRQLAICSESYFNKEYKKLISKGFTHIVTMKNLLRTDLLSYFISIQISDSESIQKNTLKHIPKIFDFLREVKLYKGKVLFVEPDDMNPRKSIKPGKLSLVKQRNSKIFLKQSVLYILTLLFKSNIYEMWSLINTQMIFYNLPVDILQKLSNLISIQRKIRKVSLGFSKFSCICGCCVFLVKSEVMKQEPADKNYGFGGGGFEGSLGMNGRVFSSGTRKIKKCRCSRVRQTNLMTECPSDGCLEYIKFLKKKYHIRHKELQWIYLRSSDFIIGPLLSGEISDHEKIKSLLLSESSLQNSLPYVKKVDMQSELFYQKEHEWRLFSCKYCQMWIFAVENLEKKIVLPLNNLVSAGKDSTRNFMRPEKKDRFEDRRRGDFGYNPNFDDYANNRGVLSFRKGPNVSIKAPVLKKIDFEDLFF